MAYKIIVIGGVNADIAGTPSGKFLIHDSNIGRISVSPGGVGRNIAKNLRALGAEVSFIAAIGDDLFADVIKDDCRQLGIDISMAKEVKGRSSSVYMYICDETGDMYAAVNDMTIVEEISPEYLSSFDLNAYDACVVDANLSRETIEYICSKVTIPLYADPVSCAKAGRIKGLHFSAIKPNEMESEILRPFDADRVYISMGKNGMHAVSKTEEYLVPAVPVSTTNANGAGDAAMAAIVIAELNGLGMKETAEFAVRHSSEVLSRK